ncbi:MAG: ATP-binding cassette domain-containing protein [Robiginitalea sp.]
MLKVDELSFGYEQEPVLIDLSFEVGRGEFLAVMGESGCGKSTLLKLIYGTLPFDKGSIQWKDRSIKGPAYQLVAGGSFVKYLAQDFDLMPYTSVSENVSKFLSAADPEGLASRTEELLQVMELESCRDKKVQFLSGGQQQRVALARVLALQPELLLLDEPFSHIDHFRRNQLRRNLFGYLKRVEKPRNLYTASLLGEANLVPIEVLKSYASTTRRIIVYSHELKVSHKSGMQVTVKICYYLGSHYRIFGVMDSGKGVVFDSEQPFETGKKVYLNVSLDTINKRLPI